MKLLLKTVFAGLVALTLTFSAVAQPAPAAKQKLSKEQKKAEKEQAKAVQKAQEKEKEKSKADKLVDKDVKANRK